MNDSPRKVLVSACLLGRKVRYDGTGATDVDHVLARWRDEGRIVMVCPEVSGGLSTPRPPAEAVGERVVTVDGVDVTAAFERGAEVALQLAREHDVALAVLKARSPSCGSTNEYDGTFSGELRPGQGVTARVLRAHGIAVFSEETLAQAQDYLRSQFGDC
jgi:uncharacterized protein YbbK (DUF523 family)